MDVPLKVQDLNQKGQKFVLEVVIDSIVYKAPIMQYNKESVTALMTIATAINMPRISGWNLYDESGSVLVSCPIAAFLNEFAEATPLKGSPADGKSAGWRAMPLVTPTSEQFADMVRQAKKDGRVPG